MAKVLILLGAPGAGKGTQAVRLAKELSLPHVSTGDLFREHLASGTELGAKAKEYMESGRLVPDDLVVDMLFAYVDREPYRAGYLLDGFPRTVSQAEALDARLSADDNVQVISLEVPDAKIVDRASGRLLCDSCGNIQHKTFSPPKAEGICDACGGSLVQRKDDRPEVVRERLAVYHEQTAPVAGFYAGSGRLCTVDGDRTPDEVFQGCLGAIAPVERGEAR